MEREIRASVLCARDGNRGSGFALSLAAHLTLSSQDISIAPYSESSLSVKCINGLKIGRVFSYTFCMNTVPSVVLRWCSCSILAHSDYRDRNDLSQSLHTPTLISRLVYWPKTARLLPVFSFYLPRLWGRGSLSVPSYLRSLPSRLEVGTAVAVKGSGARISSPSSPCAARPANVFRCILGLNLHPFDCSVTNNFLCLLSVKEFP